MHAARSTWTDAAGNEHPLADADCRIVSLVPSITELVVALGLRDRLVGRTGFCIHPKDALKPIPKVGGTKDVDLEKVRALAPTHVIVNVDENTREVALALARFVPRIIVTHPLGPRDNFELFRLLGGIFGVAAHAERLCAELAESLGAIEATPRAPRRVLYLIWRDPWMTVCRDTYISRMLALFNWQTWPCDSDSRYPEVDLLTAVSEVDEILLSTEPFAFRARHVREVSALCPGKPVRLIDGEMTSWYGSRAIEGLRYLDAFTRASARCAA
jgi:ABC-type Fe3+-hydroxamate transport system substrate-binding protein